MAQEEKPPEPKAADPVTIAAPKKRSPTRRRTTPASGPLSDPQATKGAGAAGVGGGTLVAIIATSLPEGILKTILIWLAPATTLTLSALWIWARKKIIDHVIEREIKAEFDAAKKVIADALTNQSLTAEQRGELEKKRHELEERMVDYRLSKVARRLGSS